MHRIDHPTKAADLHGAGKDGFTEGDPIASEAATVVTGDVLNAWQEEIANVIEGRGLTLNKADNTQLKQAIGDPVADYLTRVSGDEWVYPSAKTRTVVVSPAAFGSFQGNGVPDFFLDPADGMLVQQASSRRAVLDLGPYLHNTNRLTEVRVLLKPGATRPVQTSVPGDNGRMWAGLYILGANFDSPAQSIAGIPAGGTWRDEDDGTTAMQAITLTPGGSGQQFLRELFAYELHVYVGGTFTTPDRIGAVELTFDDSGPRND